VSLIDTFADGLPTNQVETILRQAGKRLAGALSRGKRPAGNLSARVATVREMMNEHLGALTHIERNGGYTSRGMGCPLAALTGKHPGVSLAIESLISEMLRMPVHECCDRSERPKYCFEIGSRAERQRTTPSRVAREAAE
jgi:predicted ArsR family transcriptional regulator